MSTTDRTEMSQTGSADARSDDHRRTGKVRREGLNWWQAIGAGAVVAAVANLAILLIGWVAGASFVVMDAGKPHEVTAWGVVVTTIPPLVLGTGLAALLARWWPGVLRWAQVIGGGLALLTVAGPMMSDTDGATRLALALMHVVVGAAVVVSLELMRRRITSARGQ
ncbi:MAG: DUF6069 family protein [Actinomycetota bacterium]|nr:DUF6069 family protein [Actinomycetota bacterium]